MTHAKRRRDPGPQTSFRLRASIARVQNGETQAASLVVEADGSPELMTAVLRVVANVMQPPPRAAEALPEPTR